MKMFYLENWFMFCGFINIGWCNYIKFKWLSDIFNDIKIC